MSLETVLQHTLAGISLGGAYALIAIGYTMVYGVLRLINFAHGEIFMMAGYFMIFFDRGDALAISVAGGISRDDRFGRRY